MVHIDNLPVDVWPFIFRNLSIGDLFNCRLVNKKYKDFSDHSDGINRLVIGKYDFYDYKYWFLNKQLIEQEDVINNFKIYQQFKLLSLFNLDRNLKYLIIYKIDDLKLNLNEQLSNLVNLEYLEIKNLNLNQIQTLDLIKLKFLIYKDCNFKLNLNTPELEFIKLKNKDKIQFLSDPKSIKHLIVDKYEDKLRIFNNLEIIQLQNLTNDLLIVFDKLRKIKFNSFADLDVIKNILRQKNCLKRDINLYFKDVKIDDIYRLDDYKSYGDNDLIYQIKNSDELDSNLSKFKIKLVYSELCSEIWFNNLKSELPSSFFNQFSHLQSIHVYVNVTNVNNLSWFLNNLINLKDLYLDLEDGSLDQTFYNNLPTKIRKLQSFSNSFINYDFILKLTKLKYFKTFNDVNLFNLAIDSYLNLIYLKDFQFKLNGTFVKIIKFKTKYNLTYRGNVEKELNYHQLVNSCNTIRLRHY